LEQWCSETHRRLASFGSTKFSNVVRTLALHPG